MRTVGLTTLFLLAAPFALAQEGEPPAPKVSVAAAYTEMITDEAVFLGRGEAVDKADIVARVEGFLEEKLVVDGEEVEEGQEGFEGFMAGKEVSHCSSGTRVEHVGYV